MERAGSWIKLYGVVQYSCGRSNLRRLFVIAMVLISSVVVCVEDRFFWVFFSDLEHETLAFLKVLRSDLTHLSFNLPAWHFHRI